MARCLIIFLLCCGFTALAVAGRPVTIKAIPYSLGPENLAVVINNADPKSVEVGEYYRLARGIPVQNMG